MATNRSRVVASLLNAINSTSAIGIPIAKRVDFLEQTLGDSIVLYLDSETVSTSGTSQTRTLTVKILCVKRFGIDDGKDTEQSVESLVEHVETNLRTGPLKDSMGSAVGKVELRSVEWDVKSGEALVAVATLTYNITYANAYQQ